MVIRVIVTGLPRSGTTITYELIARNNRGKALFLYEPFSSHIFKHYKTHGVFPKLHDYLDVTHDYDKLPNDVLNVIINNDWLLEYVEDREPYLGKYCYEILNKLHALDKLVVIKDLYLWVITDELLNKFKNLKIIFTFREVESLYNAFLKWYLVDTSQTLTKRLRKSYDKIKKYDVKTILHRFYRFINVLKYVLLGVKPDVKYFYGLSPYLKYFNLGNLDELNKETLRKIIKQIHSIYSEFVENIVEKHSDKVFVVKLEELQENPVKVVHELSNFLKPDFEILDYLIIKKL